MIANYHFLSFKSGKKLFNVLILIDHLSLFIMQFSQTVCATFSCCCNWCILLIARFQYIWISFDTGDSFLTVYTVFYCSFFSCGSVFSLSFTIRKSLVSVISLYPNLAFKCSLSISTFQRQAPPVLNILWTFIWSFYIFTFTESLNLWISHFMIKIAYEFLADVILAPFLYCCSFSQHVGFSTNFKIPNCLQTLTEFPVSCLSGIINIVTPVILTFF